jgi:hypothetical protein
MTKTVARTDWFSTKHEVQRWKAEHPHAKIEKEGPPPAPSMRVVVEKFSPLPTGPHYVWSITYSEPAE